MKEFYNEYFHIPKHGKIREKVMLVRVAITVFIMVICLAAMSLTAYAYFSYNVTSGSNIIKAANFEANVSITITDTNNDPVIVTKDGKVQTATLSAGTYTVKLTDGDSTADTGFCIITIGENTYHTAQIGEDAAKNLTDASVTFTLKVSEKTVIEILSHWGTSSFYGYDNLDNDPLYIKTTGREIDLTIVTNNADEPTGETTPTEKTHTVEADETLSAIATKYGVTVDQIAAYNKITDKDNIQVGQQLKIPPADYEFPADTTEQTTTKQETTTTTETTAPETTTPETTTSAETTTPPETSVTDPVDTTAPAETTTSTETTGTPETSAPAETTEPVETTSDETEATETTAANTDNAE